MVSASALREADAAGSSSAAAKASLWALVLPALAPPPPHPPASAQAAFERRLAGLMSTDTKSCDAEAGGCGRSVPQTFSLRRPPKVFTLSLKWEAATATEAAVEATMGSIGTTLYLSRVFRGRDGGTASEHPLRDDESPMELRALVCFYGSHYCALARTDEAAGAVWARFDDASVSTVGSWADACRACARGHLQPTVLFYHINDEEED